MICFNSMRSSVGRDNLAVGAHGHPGANLIGRAKPKVERAVWMEHHDRRDVHAVAEVVGGRPAIDRHDASVRPYIHGVHGGKLGIVLTGRPE